MWALRPFLCIKNTTAICLQLFVFLFIHSFIWRKRRWVNELLYPRSIFELLRPLSAFCFIHIRPFAQPRWHSYADVLLMFFLFFFVEVNTVAGERNKCRSQHSLFMWLLPSSAKLSDIIVSPQSSSCPGLAGRCRLILDAILNSVGFCFGAQTVNLLLKHPE